MRLLVLGGGRFVGWALVHDALARGWQVSALRRGITGRLPDGVEALQADRTDPEEFARAVAGRRFDAVVDTWSGASRVVRDNAAVLRGLVDRYGYVSTSSVYRWGEHQDETSPVVEAGARDGDEVDYARAKRGSELAILAHFPDAVLARAGLVLGPHEDIGRLPWWLNRIAAGGRVVAPGTPDRPLQYVDARDLARWLLDALAPGTGQAQVRGPVDVVGPSGHATTGTLLEACRTVTGSDAEFVWIDQASLARAGVQPWVQLPAWVPQDDEFAGFLEKHPRRALATGLSVRPVLATVRDTWQWLQESGAGPQRADRPVHGLPAELERQLLDGQGRSSR